ncbi:MAG: TlpA family protein disulfide reductase [Planctomycetaceae bacterium]|jgi:thiol-disulfide isomerase/thioredoxin|nr:TlpA family protein disulfide reductase [Planctomycetaceae bacterium]
MKSKLFQIFVLFAILTVFSISTQVSIQAQDNSTEQPWLVETTEIVKKGIPIPNRPQMLWANSVRFQNITEVLGGPIEIERWVNEPPKDVAGKFVLIEVWATWCPPCRRSLALLEYFHKKYKNELVVFSICETDEEALKKMDGSTKLADIKAPLAVDTYRRFANKLGVWGIPHAVLIEPINGAILWEGMPTQIGYELNDEKLGKILANLKKPAVIAKLPQTAPFEIKTCPPDPNKPNEKPKTEMRSAGEEDGITVEKGTIQ